MGLLKKFTQLQLEFLAAELSISVNVILSCCSISVIDVLSSAVGKFSVAVFGNLAAAFEFLKGTQD
jgi:hypothetical protein